MTERSEPASPPSDVSVEVRTPVPSGAKSSTTTAQRRPALVRTSSNAVGVRGSWTLEFASVLHELQLTNAHRELVAGVNSFVLDGSEIEAFDTVGALYLMRMIGGHESLFDLQGFEEREVRLLSLVQDRYRSIAPPKVPVRLGLFGVTGKAALHLVATLQSLLGFVGLALAETAQSIANPKRFRMKEFGVHLEQALVHPIPIVCLVMFLIGIVLSYLFAGQIERYGANIFIVDGVALALCRELSPVIVAIIVAGRSGSAYTAHIGAMKISEEIEAIQTIGLSPIRVLVVPRMLALILALPILVFVGDIVGMLGGMLIAESRLGITGATFLARLQQVLPPRHIFVGIGKAPVFALFIAIIGCRMGFLVEKNARSLGLSTTATVVQSIVSVILLNAFFAVLFMELRI